MPVPAVRGTEGTGRTGPEEAGAGMALTDAQWAALEPLIEACRPRGKTPPSHLRRTVEAIVWRCTNGAKWRAIPAELGPWWRAAQTFIRWARLGVWDRLLAMAQEQRVELGMAFLDGTSVRAHAKAAGAAQKGDLARAAASVRRLADLAAAMAPRPSSSPMGVGAP
jgi:transposase